ncbi:formyltransferase family protein [uncultured Croceitalea sp.]|uniref:formyltransferase family protein n=1 Tax=uncultured Croceitalea sp. TaxID=1798908 RepID=UPI00374E4DE8
MDILILTTNIEGSAALNLRELLKSDTISVKMVIYNKGEILNKKKYYHKRIKKVLKVGICGALNGIRMRKWYIDDVLPYLKNDSIDVICKKNNIPFKTTPSINCSKTIELFKMANADLGLSIGNTYITSKIFTVPKLGMLNIHYEELPDYQNATGIIWQIYNRSNKTGFTIHKIDKHIDTGPIFYKEKIDLVFKKNLRETVSYNYSRVLQKSTKSLRRVIENFDYYHKNSIMQCNGNTYTTPTITQYLKIKRNFKLLRDNVEK